MWSAFARYGGLVAARVARPVGNGSAIGVGIGLAALAFALFSTMDALIKWLSAAYPVHQMLFFNASFALLPVALATWRSGGLHQWRTRRLPLHLLRAFCGMTAAYSAFTAFGLMPLADAYALIFTTPLLITVLSVLLLGEQVRWRRWSAILVGFTGVLIMLRPGSSGFGPGTLPALVAALASATSIVLVRKLSTTETTAAIAFYTNATVVVVMAALLPLGFVAPTLDDLALMAAAGLAGGTAVLLLIGGYRRSPAAIVAPFQYSQMVWGVVIGFVVWGHLPDIAVAVGAAIVVASGLFILYREVELETTGPQAAPVEPRAESLTTTG